MHKHVTEKYLPTLLFLVVFGFLLYFLKPFIGAILGAIVLAILCSPLYKKLLLRTHNATLSASLLCGGVVFVFLVPLYFIIQTLFLEISQFIAKNSFTQSILAFQLFLETHFGHLSYAPVDVSFLVERVVSFIGGSIQDLVSKLPEKFLLLFVMLFLFYYLLKDGNRILNIVFTVFAVSAQKKQELLKHFSMVTYGVVYGQVLTAILQGIVATIGYIIFGVKLPFLVGLLTVIFAFIPMLGTSIVWFPIGLFFLLQGSYFQGFGLLFFGVFVVSIVDNFARPKLISGKIQMHPALVLLGVVSGLQMFGIMGLFIGPLFIAAGKELLKYYLSHNLHSHVLDDVAVTQKAKTDKSKRPRSKR